MNKVAVVGAGLAGSEAALQLAQREIQVTLFEMRPFNNSEVHKTDLCAELVCSNSLKSTKRESASGMLKEELRELGSFLYQSALKHRVAAGGALAVDREAFSSEVTDAIVSHPNITFVRKEIRRLDELLEAFDAVLLTTGPLTSPSLSEELSHYSGSDYFSFYDAAAPIIMADSLDREAIFSQNRYDRTYDEEDLSCKDSSEVKIKGIEGDYLNAPMDKERYELFVTELLNAQLVIKKDFERSELFQACQPVEEIARSGHDALRFGALKPVGLTDPITGKRPYAVVQLRPENAEKTAYNLVGFQTNLTFSEQQRVFSLIPGLSHAEFARYGVMHKNTFINAPLLLNKDFRFISPLLEKFDTPLYVAGQLSGTEGYGEAIRGGIHAALSIAAYFKGIEMPPLSRKMVFGSLVAYATDSETQNYQPMHVNFGIIEPLDYKVKNKGQRYEEYAKRGSIALAQYKETLINQGLI